MYANPKEDMIDIKQTDFDAVYKKRVEYIQKYRITGDNKNILVFLQNYRKLLIQNPMN